MIDLSKEDTVTFNLEFKIDIDEEFLNVDLNEILDEVKEETVEDRKILLEILRESFIEKLNRNKHGKKRWYGWLG